MESEYLFFSSKEFWRPDKPDKIVIDEFIFHGKTLFIFGEHSTGSIEPYDQTLAASKKTEKTWLRKVLNYFKIA